MPRENYGNVTLRKEMCDRVDRLVAVKGLGFKSRADLVTAALRDYLRRLEAEQRNQQTLRTVD